MSEAASLLPEDPRRIGTYELHGRLGQGGQGVVYLGSGASGERVAVKLLQASLRGDDPARARFVRELAVARRVARFCTAQVLDADIDGDRPYIVSEYVAGPSLSQVVAEQGPLPGAQLERLAIGTATALAAIHQAGIVHRDFKPGNVLLAQDGPRVIDFGVAKALDPAATGASAVVGTPSYMAPEQFGTGRVGTETDVWAWGATIVYAATARPPFGADTIPAVMGRILHGSPRLGDLPEPLRELVSAALDRDPAARPTSAELLMRLIGHGGDTADIMAEGRTLAAATRADTPVTRADAPPAGAGGPAGAAAPPPSTAVLPGEPAGAPSPRGGGGRRWIAPGVLSAVAVLVAIGAIFWAANQDDRDGTPESTSSTSTGQAANGKNPPATSGGTIKPAGPRLMVSPVGDVKVGDRGSIEVTLTAEGGDVEWRAEATGLTLSRSFGTLRNGQSVRIKITLTDPYVGTATFEAEGTPEQQVKLASV
ncbi:serine/threonine-protein kinase [Actinomadura viridis]|uniref:serine/threonine-protein kinase n=1 Tax=Actinomadura viridis TaxID=58110 RepID=UPI0036995DBF